MTALSAEGYRMINGHQALYHSQYKGWELYRCYDGGSPRMLYFAVAITDTGGLTVLEARNLASIKKKSNGGDSVKPFPKKLVNAILSLRNWKAKACDRNNIFSAKFHAICNDIVYLHVDSSRISGEPLNFRNGEYVAPGSFKIPLMDVKGETVRVNTEALKKVLACMDSEYVQIFAKSDGLLWIHGTAYDVAMVAAAICPIIDLEEIE